MKRTGMDEGIEVTDEVFESPASLVFDQAENGLHMIRATLSQRWTTTDRSLGGVGALSSAGADHAVRMTTSHPARGDAAAMFRNVVVGIRDALTGRDALALAVELAWAEIRLTLVHVLDVSGRPARDSGAAWAASQRRRAKKDLRALADGVPPGTNVACVEARSPRRGLHEFAAGHGADLLVIRATDRDDVDRDLIGDDARRVLEDPPCPVAVAPRGYRDHGRGITRIGVAYDETGQSRRALALARTLANEHGTELSAFEAVDGPGYAHDSWEMQEDIDVYVTQARHRISALGGVHAEAGFGHHVDELARYAESVDLLVIGAHRYTLVDRVLERSTAQRLVDVTATPLLVLPAPVAQVREHHWRPAQRRQGPGDGNPG